MSVIKCPSCGSPNVEQVNTNKYQCPYCGKEFVKAIESSSNSESGYSVFSEETNEDGNSFGIYNVIGWLFI